MVQQRGLRQRARTSVAMLWRYMRDECTPKTYFAVLLPWLPIFLLVLALVGVVKSTSQRSGFSNFVTDIVSCDPNGQTSTHWRWSQPSYWIAITSKRGGFPFAVAKAIDVAWDLAVGRGWQAATGWLLYSVFHRCWAVHWKAHRDSIPVEAAMALQYETVSLKALRVYHRILWRSCALPRQLKWDTAVLIAAALYVLASSTWLSAMTGYVTATRTMFNDGDSSVEMKFMKECEYVVHDGERVGLHSDACVPLWFWDDEALDFRNAIVRYYFQYYSVNVTTGTWVRSGGSSNLTLDGEAHILTSPVLNISYTEMRGIYGYRGRGKAYSFSDLKRLGVCQLDGTYQWGFSAGLSCLFLIVTIVLGLALYISWVCTFQGGELADSTFGTLKTAMAVFAAIEKLVVSRAAHLSNAELESERKRLAIAVPLVRQQQLVKRLSGKSLAPVIFEGT